MRGRSALVEGGRCSARHRLSKDVASVSVEISTSRLDIGGEVTDAEEAAAEIGKEVDVQVLVCTFTQGRLHRRIIVARRPLVIDRKIGTEESEGDAGRPIAAIQDGKLGDISASTTTGKVVELT